MTCLEIAVIALVAILAPLVAAWADMKLEELSNKEARQ